MSFKFIFLSMVVFFSTTIGFSQQHKTKNVILISIDGYRWQEVFRGADSTLLAQKKYHNQSSATLHKKYWAATPEDRRKKLMPFFWGTIAKEGQLYGNRDLGNKVDVKNKYWFSYPGRSETICGYADDAINSNSYPDNPNENVLEFVNKQNGYKGKVATIAGWDAVAKIVNRDRNHMPLINPYEDVEGSHLTEAQKLANETQHYMPLYFGKSIRFDVSTYAIAKSYISANHPKLIYIDFVDPDDFGHAGKYDFYLDAGHSLDAMIKNIWEMIQADPFYRNNTTIMICPDHGRGVGDRWVNHGSETPHSGETWMAIIGPDTPAKGEIKTQGQIYQDQFAQTIAHLLGFNFTANHPVSNYLESAMGN